MPGGQDGPEAGSAAGPGAVLKDAHKRAAIVSASILVTLAVFVIVVEVLKRSGGAAERGSEDFDVLRIVFYAIAISLVLVINLVHGFMLKGTRTDDIVQLAAKLVSVNVITSGLAETPAIMGFVLFLGWGYHLDFYVLGFVSLYLMLRHFPYYRQWEKFARDRMGEKWPVEPVSGG
jgi:hypothetical protein